MSATSVGGVVAVLTEHLLNLGLRDEPCNVAHVELQLINRPICRRVLAHTTTPPTTTPPPEASSSTPGKKQKNRKQVMTLKKMPRYETKSRASRPGCGFIKARGNGGAGNLGFLDPPPPAAPSNPPRRARFDEPLEHIEREESQESQDTAPNNKKRTTPRAWGDPILMVFLF